MRLRYFNEAGMVAAAELLDRIREGREEGVPIDFLSDGEFTVDAGVDIVRPRVGELRSRWHLGLWLYQKLQDRVPDRSLFLESGLWTWLAFLLFDVICSADSSGTRQVKSDYRYIFRRGDFRTAYRHLVAGPFFVVRTHADRPNVTRCILAGDPSKPGELYEQIASRKPIVTSSGALSVVERLYWDAATEKLRSRAGSKDGPGTPRRYARVLMQLDVTHDLYAASEERLSSILPREFTSPHLPKRSRTAARAED